MAEPHGFDPMSGPRGPSPSPSDSPTGPQSGAGAAAPKPSAPGQGFPNEPAGHSNDGAASPPTGAIAESLFGNWRGDGQSGNCIDYHNWYTFMNDGSVVSRYIDQNACSGDRLVAKASGRYALDGRLLTITLDGSAGERPYDVGMPAMAIAQRIETMTVAVGGRPAQSGRDAQTWMDARAYQGHDGARFESTRSARMTSAAGELVYADEVAIALELDPPLPLAVGDHTRVRVQATLSHFAMGEAGTSTEPVAVQYEYPAVVRDEYGWMRIMPEALDGLTGQAAVDAWNALLDAQHVAGGEPVWLRSMLDYPSQRFEPGDTTMLTSTLPELGRWQQSKTPPPLQ